MNQDERYQFAEKRYIYLLKFFNNIHNNGAFIVTIPRDNIQYQIVSFRTVKLYIKLFNSTYENIVYTQILISECGLLLSALTKLKMHIE